MTRRLCIALAATALVLAACSKSDEPAPDASAGSSEKLVQISPLSGLPMNARPSNPVFVVKIENTGGGAPQINLDKADLVVEELVEGGLTRLAAFYYSVLPNSVGHVRSMRASDIGIAKPVAGQIVASGGAAGTYKKVKRAGVKVWSEDYGAPGFSSDPAKVRPYNRLIDLNALTRRAAVKDIPGSYFQWATAGKETASPDPSASAAPPKPAAQTATKASVRFSPSSTTQWAFTGGAWKRTNGHASKEYAASTLIVMFCDVGDAGYLDPAGNPVPETKLEGKGKAVILSGKTVTDVTWRKDSLGSTIRFVDSGGTQVPVEPGKIWLELVPKAGGGVNVN